MIDTLAHMQDVLGGNADAAQCEFKNLQGWFIGSRLLRRDDLIELHSELGQGRGKEIVVHVGNDGQTKAAPEFAECGYGVRPWLPFLQGLRQRADLLAAGLEPELLPELPHDRLKHLAIAAVLPLLSTGFEVAV